MTINNIYKKKCTNLHNLDYIDLTEYPFLTENPRILKNLKIILSLFREEIEINCKDNIEITLAFKFKEEESIFSLLIYSLEDPLIFKHIFSDMLEEPSFEFLIFDLINRNPYTLFKETMDNVLLKMYNNSDISIYITFEEYNNLLKTLNKISYLFDLNINVKDILNNSTCNSCYALELDNFIIQMNYKEIILISLAVDENSTSKFSSSILLLDIRFDTNKFNLHILGNSINIKIEDFFNFNKENIEHFITGLFKLKNIDIANINDLKNYLTVKDIIQY